MIESIEITDLGSEEAISLFLFLAFIFDSNSNSVFIFNSNPFNRDNRGSLILVLLEFI